MKTRRITMTVAMLLFVLVSLLACNQDPLKLGIPLVDGSEVRSLAGEPYDAWYREEGGAKMVGPSGTELEMRSGSTLDIQSGATIGFAGNLDMNSALILNIGDTGTDFGPSGELTTAQGITVTAGGIIVTSGQLDMTTGAVVNIGNAGTDFGPSGELTTAQGITVTSGGIIVTSGNLDMTTGVIYNIGAAGTDFGLSGELTTAQGITVTAGGIIVTSGSIDMTTGTIVNIGNAGTDFGPSGELTLAQALTITAGGIDVAGGVITLENDETISNATDNFVTVTVPGTGHLGVTVGNLHVGSGVPSSAMDGEDGYIEGSLEIDGAVRFDGLLDMVNDPIYNIGAAGTDFGLSGELTTAQGITVTAGGIIVTSGQLDMTTGAVVNIGNAGTDFGPSGELTLAQGLTITSGSLDMNVGTIVDIGNAGTDFGPSGELTTAQGITITTGGINVGGDADIDGDLVLESVLTLESPSPNVNVGVYTLNPTTTHVLLNPGGTLTLTLGTSGVVEGDTLVLVNVASQNVVVQTTNLYWSASYTMNQYDTLMLIFYSSNWYEISRSVNS